MCVAALYKKYVCFASLESVVEGCNIVDVPDVWLVSVYDYGLVLSMCECGCVCVQKERIPCVRVNGNGTHVCSVGMKLESLCSVS